VNYDVPYDTESYVHRIGRTGRAGRSGEAILFIAPRERNLLRLIERHTRQAIEPLRLPTVEDVNVRRLAKLKARIGEALAAGASDYYRRAVEEVSLETGADLLAVGAAILSLVEGGAPVAARNRAEPAGEGDAGDRGPRGGGQPGGEPLDTREDAEQDGRPARGPRAPSAALQFEDDGRQVTWRLAVGRRNGVLPGNIVGAIANESGLTGQHINGVDIRADYTLVRLPAALPQAIIDRLSRTVVRGQALNLEPGDSPPRRAFQKPKPHRKGKPRPS
jgi:ATP-dependent RNA helicase DeaD